MIPTCSSMRILLVDDVQLDRMQLAMRLKQLGHLVESVSSGKEALAVYANFEPELVLLDINMPEMDGFAVSQAIREIFVEWVPIIFLSSYEEPEMIAQAIAARGDDYLIKPVNKLVLSSKLIAMQRIATMRRELKQKTAKLAELNELLQQQANEDGLTKLFNRRYVDQQLAEMIGWHGRHQTSVSLILLDVDHFKAFNDNYGHIEGDKCLQEIARNIKALFNRSGECVGRYGGEEFVVVLDGVDHQHALHAAERVQGMMNRLAYCHNYSDVAHFVTLSQGVFTFIPQGNGEIEWIYKQADHALYQAKLAGRNQYVSAESCTAI
ncbi:diguanylate cyclase response regulator [Vibrio navarrensis]|uniref:diguanylate cyclase n=1 Tax=Vibrio navarrensis TaxID=29495 RepID=UPI00186A4B61|nr:diguanylate cyclase [Vibrio navarrensis]MBE4573259.1 diguanylate cyclase response regulator [Vibrio navarrensis]MBE4585656.1 diguanylate cyclase response regulator [Vibrio navarrensis]MBE4607794.1 diguanylate cyclase response regulator [Vibrio navarrensis]MBE4611172.1 diguanylate cyclase response regulator [Vibrio navarrensis]